MSNELWKIVLKETFVTWDLIVLLCVPVVAWLITLICFKTSPLRSENAWSSVGRRVSTLGGVLLISSILIYAAAVVISFARQKKENAIYTKTLQLKFRDYYAAQKSYTQRMIDFAERVADHKEILAEMDNFATNLPVAEREKLGRAWSASNHGGNLIRSGNTFNGLEEKLYWPEEKIEKYKKANNGMKPGIAELRYTKEQIKEFKDNNWSKLYPMLDPEQWIFIKNQILLISERENVLGFLRDITDVFQMPDPTASLNGLYERMADRACPTDGEKIEFYLAGKPNLLKAYKMSLKHRFWARNILLLVIFIAVGAIFCSKGKKISADGKKRIFQ